MADFIGNRHLKKNNIPANAFVIFDSGEFYNGCSLGSQTSEIQQWIIENGILKLKALIGSPYRTYELIINQSPESGTGKTKNSFGVDVAIPTPNTINFQGIVVYGPQKTYKLPTPWYEKKVYSYNLPAGGETSFKVKISVDFEEGQSATVGQTIFGIRSIWYK